MQALVRKKFVLYYKPTFPGGEGVKLVEGMDYFTEENGFSVYDIDDVSNMDEDDCITTGPMASLKVVRVK